MLDEKDKLLIEYLMHDCRMTTTKLSKLTGMKQPTVVYRMKRLEREGYISKYDAIFDLNLVKTPIDMFFIKISNEKREDFEKKIKGDKRFESMFRLSHRFNYYISGFLGKEGRKEIKKYFKGKKFDFKHYTWKEMKLMPFSIFDLGLIHKTKLEDIYKKVKRELGKIDGKDIKIINAMMDGGGRDSILKLAERTGLNADIVFYRFKKLTKAGAFPLFLAQPGNEKFNIQVDMILLKLKGMELDDVEREFRKIEKTLHVVDLGENKYFTQILTRDFGEYKDVLDKICNVFRERLDGIEIYNTKDWFFLNRVNLTLKNFNRASRV